MSIPVAYHDRRQEGETTLRQAQLVLLHLLYVFDAICRKHGIQYWLAWGSCLGALRHDGFIPWDDDLDVGMTAKDYRRVLKILPKELPEDVRLQIPKGYPKIAICFAKLRDTHSFCGEARYDTTLLDPSGLYIDLFPFDEVPDVGASLAKLLIKVCGSTWHRYYYFKHLASRSIRTALWSIPLAAVCKFCNILALALVSFLRLVLPCSNLSDAFNHGEARLYKKDWFKTTVPHKFEDGEFPIPVEADGYLKVRYGDWHWIPPPEKRPRHATIIDPFHSVNGNLSE